MQFRRTPEFKECIKLLDDKQRQEIQDAFPELEKAFHGDMILNRKFNLHPLKKYDGIYAGHLKYNLVFTFHYETSQEGEKIVFFRRIGTHNIYNNP
jgi:mRNA-degrading endonuclease YafQ of YafQ-DinJ toxin-antitoxin module